MTNAADIKYWQALSTRDADAMMRWLTAIGFTEHATYRDEDDPAVVVHAEWLWPGGGGLMFGTERPEAGIHNVGSSAVYLVTDDPDALFEKAIAAGGTELLPMTDQDYGGRSGSVADPEANHWSFGSYQPS